MTDQPFVLPPNFDNTVRLFPLPDLVAFPHNMLPLHLFESRYREMMEDAMKGDQLITMATLLPGFDHDYYSRPPISSTACIGRVVAHKKTDQGTYSLMLALIQRAQIEHEIEPVRAFRRAKVTLIEDCLSDTADRKILEQLAGRVRRTLPSAQELIGEFIQRKISLSSLTDILAFHLPLKMEFKLELLAEANVAVRAERLLANWPLAERDGGGLRRFPVDFSEN